MEGIFDPEKFEELIEPHELLEPYDVEEELLRAYGRLVDLDIAIGDINRQVQELLDAGYALNSPEVIENCDLIYALRKAWNLWEEDWSELRWELEGWPDPMPRADFATLVQARHPLDIEAIKKRMEELCGK